MALDQPHLPIDWLDIPLYSQPTAVAMGSFDGLHQGHLRIIETVHRLSKQKGLQPIVLSFHPHPKHYFSHGSVPNLYTAEEKAFLFKRSGTDHFFILRFDEGLAQTPAIDFLREVLIKRLKARAIVIGYDHHFGKGREGNARFLSRYQNLYGYQTISIPKVSKLGKKISSSRVRMLLTQGRIKEANSLLLLPFFYQGEVIPGDQMGRKLGFPTINLSIPKEKITIKKGVYFGLAEVLGQTPAIYPAMINLGFRPTFADPKRILIEAHLLDFHQELYHRTVRLYFLKFMRRQKRFASPQQLTEQLTKEKKQLIRYQRSIAFRKVLEKIRG